MKNNPRLNHYLVRISRKHKLKHNQLLCWDLLNKLNTKLYRITKQIMSYRRGLRNIKRKLINHLSWGLKINGRFVNKILIIGEFNLIYRYKQAIRVILTDHNYQMNNNNKSKKPNKMDYANPYSYKSTPTPKKENMKNHSNWSKILNIFKAIEQQRTIKISDTKLEIWAS